MLNDKDSETSSSGSFDYWLYLFNSYFYLIVWYAVGCILASFVIQEMVFSVILVVSAGCAIFYWSIYSIIDLIYRILWLFTNFGFQIGLLLYLWHYISSFATNVFDLVQFDKKKFLKLKLESNKYYSVGSVIVILAILIIPFLNFMFSFSKINLVDLVMVTLIVFQVASTTLYIRKVRNTARETKKKAKDFIKKDSKKYHIFDPINISPLLALLSEYKRKMDNSTGVNKTTKKLTLYLGIPLTCVFYVFVRMRKSFSYVDPINCIIYITIQYFLSDFNSSINLLSCFSREIDCCCCCRLCCCCCRCCRHKEEEGKNQITNEVKQLLKKIKVSSFIKYVIWIYIILTCVIITLLSVWGLVWQTPNKAVESDTLFYSFTNASVKSPFQESALCKLKGGNLNIVQLSALPTLMYCMNRGKQINLEMNDFQKKNLKVLQQYIFGDYASRIRVNYSTLTPWGVQIIVPQENKTNNSDIVFQIYGGYRTPLDWALFLELFTSKYLSLVFNSAIRFFDIITSMFGSFYQYILGFGNGVFLIQPYTEDISNILRRNYINSRRADVIVGQGIGGMFAKLIWERIEPPQTEIAFSFESLKITRFLNIEALFSSENISKSKPLINNVFTNTMYSEYEPLVDNNFKRKGRDSAIKADEAFTTFCSTAAICADTSLFDPLCFEVGKDYLEQTTDAERQYIY